MKIGKRIYLFFLVVIGKVIDGTVGFLENRTRRDPIIGFENVYALTVGIYSDAIMIQGKINTIKKQIRTDLQKPKVTIE